MVAAVLYDVHFGTFRHPDTGSLLTVSASPAAVALAALPALLGNGARGARPRVLVCVAGAVAVMSLVCTMGLHLTARDADASSAYGAFEPVAVLVLLAVTVRRGTPAAAAAVTVLLLGAVIARPVALHVREGSVIVAFVLTLVAVTVTGASLAVRLVVAGRRQRDHRIRLEQRVRLARELHDFVAHHVTGIVVQAQGAQAIVARRPDMVVPALERIEQAGAEALLSLRRMVGGLRSEDTGDEGAADIDEARARFPVPAAGIGELRGLVAGFGVPGMSAHLAEDGPTDTLPPDVAAVVHRVAMESLTNVRKHAADCRDVRVRVRVEPQRAVLIEVGNDGTARHPAAGPGYGLKGLAERVTELGGIFRAGATADGGWLVHACLPLPSAGGRGGA